MRMLLLAAAASLCALAGCQSVDVNGAIGKIDAAIQQSLPQVCQAGTAAHAVYLDYLQIGKVSARDQAAVDAAWTNLQSLCANPSGQSAASVLSAAVSAAVTIKTVLAHAKG